jgi:hypothetical protein
LFFWKNRRRAVRAMSGRKERSVKEERPPTSVDHELSEAIALYVGYGVENHPRLQPERLVSRFGEVRAREVMRALFPELSERALDALKWYFSWSWR